MNLTRCENGHFYDGDAYTVCPHCHKSDDAATVALTGMETTGKSVVSIEEVLSKRNESSEDITVPMDDQKTVRYYEELEGIKIEPVVGWLVCIEGDCIGQDFKLKAGKNFIGRAANMDVVLSTDSNVARNRHAILIFEPKSRLFIAQPGDSRELFYLNENVVLGNEVMKAKDVLTVGKTKLMLIPCCDDSFSWEDILKEESK